MNSPIAERSSDSEPARPDASRLQLLAESSRAFSEAAADLPALYATICRRIAEALGDACSLRLLTEDGVLVRTVAVHHADPAAQAMLATPHAMDLISLDQGAGGEVLRTGRSLLLAGLTPDALPAPFFNPRLVDHARTFPLYSLVAVPLRIAGRPSGALVVTRHRPGLSYTPDDQRLLEELADHAALALFNARLAIDQQEARAEAARAASLAERLHEMLSGVVNAQSPQQVAELIVSQGLDALRAQSGVLAVLDPDGDVLECLGARGYPKEFLERFQSVELDGDAPLQLAARTGEPQWIESRPEFLARFPAFAPKAAQVFGSHALCCIPLSVEGRLVGALAFSFGAPHVFTQPERAFALTLARQCAQALERVQLLDQERQLKEAARFVAQASSRLSESLDLRTTLASLSSLLVPALADRLAVHLAQPDGSLSLEYAADTERGGELLLAELLRGDARALLPSPEELDLGAARLRGKSSGPGGSSGRVDEVSRRAMEALGVKSWLTVPLRSRGRTLGTLSLGRRQAGYSIRQMDVVEELGRRAALAVDNAGLYEMELRSRKRAEQLLARTDGLQRLTAAISRALTSEDVAAVVVRQGLEVLSALNGAVWILTPDGQGLELIQVEHPHPEPPRERHPLPLAADTPIAEAVRARAPVWVESWVEISTRYPAIAAQLRRPHAGMSMCCLPLEAEDRVFGGLAFSFDGDRRLTAEDRALLEVLAGICAQGLERARLYESERRARERLAKLASASELLASSLDYETTLHTVAGLALPALADFAILDVIENEGEGRRICQARDPEKLALLATTRFLPDDAWLRQENLRPELLRAMGTSSLVTVPLRSNGRLLGALTLCFAESGRRHTGEDLQLAEELARRAAAAVENARLFHQSQQAIQLRDDFLSIAGHELNTPLTSLKIHLDSLRGRPLEGEQAKRKLEKVSQQTTRLAKLVTALLDVSRITAGRLTLEPQPMDLALTVRDVANRLGEDLSRSGSELRMEALEGVVGTWDGFRMDQVVTNLLSNAIKYGQGHAIEVSLRASAERAVLEVKDGGIGIAPEKQPRLFQRFERAVSNKHYGGFGLGLWIVKQVVEAHGGSIRVQSNPGAGSTFVVELPRQPAPAPEHQAERLS